MIKKRAKRKNPNHFNLLNLNQIDFLLLLSDKYQSLNILSKTSKFDKEQLHILIDDFYELEGRHQKYYLSILPEEYNTDEIKGVKLGPDAYLLIFFYCSYFS